MRSLAVCLVFVITLLITTCAPASMSASASASEPGITWESCPLSELPTRECATLEVPLDYDETDGATVSLAVARVPATTAERRIGSLITNPGGPGGSGVDALPLLYAALPETLTTHFDLVGFDPRGVGQSAPVRCFDSIAERTAFFTAIPSVPIGAEEVAARLRSSEDLAQRCGEHNADVLPHLSTANVARDMDQLRQAVGDEQLSYLGSSYGTYLGATYANLFPDRIRAMVLDGVINPPSYTSAEHGDGDVVGPETTSFLRILSDRGSAKALQEFFNQCAAAGPTQCAFAPEDAEATRAKLDALLQQLGTEPMVVHGPAGTLSVTYSLVAETVRGSLYAAPMWCSLG